MFFNWTFEATTENTRFPHPFHRREEELLRKIQKSISVQGGKKNREKNKRTCTPIRQARVLTYTSSGNSAIPTYKVT